MKKTLALILAIVMALGCMSITAFAAENEAEITAEITAADFGYTMVIPTATTLTEANHENVLLGTDGKVSIKDIKHPTDKVNVVYTVDLSNGNLTDGTNTIGATYKYKQGANEFAAIDGTTKVTVYANKTVTDSLVNVTANKDQWNAAPAGTYNASVTFNFAQEKVFATVGEIIATAPAGSLTSNFRTTLWYETVENTKATLNDDALEIPAYAATISLDAAVDKQEDGTYKVIEKEEGSFVYYFVFKIEDDALSAIEYHCYNKNSEADDFSVSLTLHEAPFSA